jgi:hypothetical protein
MEKFQQGNLAPPGQRCPLCGERRRRNLIRHSPSGEFVCQPCHDALRILPSWKLDLRGLRGCYGRRLGPA